MNKEYEEIITVLRDQHIHAFIELKPGDFDLFENVECKKHYTFVCMIPGIFKESMIQFQNNLRNFDKNMIFNDPGKLHLTIFYTENEDDIEKAEKAIIHDANNLAFNLNGLMASKNGIGILAMPQNEALQNMRKKFYSSTGRDFSCTPRDMFSWVTLARSSMPPSRELLNFIRQNINNSIGIYKPEKIELYLSTNKNLVGAKRIKEYHLEA